MAEFEEKLVGCVPSLSRMLSVTHPASIHLHYALVDQSGKKIGTVKKQRGSSEKQQNRRGKHKATKKERGPPGDSWVVLRA